MILGFNTGLKDRIVPGSLELNLLVNCVAITIQRVGP